MYIFADLDGTLAKSRQKIEKDMAEFLSTIPLIVVSGSRLDQMRHQLDGFEPQALMAQSGNLCIENGDVLWENRLNENQLWEIKEHISSFGCLTDNPESAEYRGCQVSYSLVGHNAPQKIKDRFDPQRKIRTALLDKYPLVSDSVEVRIGGTTCLDYTAKGFTKGKNIADYIARKNIKKEDCVYIGDALFKGGNDESVNGVIKTYQTSGPEQTKEIITLILSRFYAKIGTPK